MSCERQRGVALAAVLWIVALLTVLGSAVAAMSVAGRRAVDRIEQTERARLEADGAIRMMFLRIMSNRPGNSIVFAGRESVVRVWDADVRVLTTMEAGRVDLNFATEELFDSLLQAGKIDSGEARELSRNIMAWRDSGGRKLAFESVDQIRQVAGGEKLPDEIVDAFTVYGRMPQPIPSVAPKVVQMALARLDVPIGPAASVGVQSGDVVRLRACASQLGMSVCRTAIARVTGNAIRPVQVFAWL